MNRVDDSAFWDLHHEAERLLNVPIRPSILRTFVSLGTGDSLPVIPVLSEPQTGPTGPLPTLAEFTRAVQRDYLIKIITIANGKTNVAAKTLDISINTLYRHLDACGIKIADIKATIRANRKIRTKMGEFKPISRDSLAENQILHPIRGGNPIVIASVDFSTESVRFRRNNHVELRHISWLTKNFGAPLRGVAA